MPNHRAWKTTHLPEIFHRVKWVTAHVQEDGVANETTWRHVLFTCRGVSPGDEVFQHLALKTSQATGGAAHEFFVLYIEAICLGAAKTLRLLGRPPGLIRRAQTLGNLLAEQVQVTHVVRGIDQLTRGQRSRVPLCEFHFMGELNVDKFFDHACQASRVTCAHERGGNLRVVDVGRRPPRVSVGRFEVLNPTVHDLFD